MLLQLIIWLSWPALLDELTLVETVTLRPLDTCSFKRTDRLSGTEFYKIVLVNKMLK